MLKATSLSLLFFLNYRWLFFSVVNSNPRIERCRMDGKDRIIIVSEDIMHPNGMSIGKYIIETYISKLVHTTCFRDTENRKFRKPNSLQFINMVVL